MNNLIGYIVVTFFVFLITIIFCDTANCYIFITEGVPTKIENKTIWFDQIQIELGSVDFVPAPGERVRICRKCRIHKVSK